MKQNKHQLGHLPTLLVQQIRLQWYKDCRGGNAAAQRNQYPRAMRLPKDFFSYYPFGLPTHFASIIQRPDCGDERQEDNHMISTKDLSGLPNAERLKNFCKGLAALDIIMVEEEWSFIRHYTYNPAWRKGKEAFFATDGSDQSMIVMFAPEGCVINGVDSELYDWEKKLPRIEDLTDGMPPALQKLMGSREVKKMKSTFCVWTEDGTTWNCNPMDGEDASKDLLTTIDGNPQTYVKYGKWFYPADLPLEAVRQLADGGPVTKELVVALNPKRNEWEEIKAGLDKIGDPNEL